MPRPIENYVAYFEKKTVRVPFSGCWLWTGATQPQGYGILANKSGRYLAHRVSYEKHVGEFDRKLDVLHTCDVKCCINPNHLYLGNDLDNAKDRLERGGYIRKQKEDRTLFCRHGHATPLGSRTKNGSCMTCCKLVWHKRSVERNILRKKARHGAD